jgi:hypothetical protein
MYNTSFVLGKSVVAKKEKIFLFQNAQGYFWRCSFLQRWRCNSRS